MPTLEGGLKIDVETATDWLVLEQIPGDAMDNGAEGLPERLGALMDDDCDWDEVVIPELKTFFSGQLRRVREVLKQAQDEAGDDGDDDAGAVFIGREDAGDWYGALNQARLSLETRYKFGPTDGIESLEAFPEAKRSAFIRSQFYCALQSILLEYVLD
ncbi:MAG: hypothetical protein HKO57_16770 [Akkermansiaceae bacterium]|nr:hypothetical protein [Akkermansiaceae bacterium]